MIEENVNLNGIPLTLIDTAGIRQTDDIVEKIGVERSLQSIDEADLVIVVLDAKSGIDNEDKEVLSSTQNSKRIILINKTDISSPDFTDKLAEYPNEGIIEISAKTAQGIDTLADKIRRMYELDKITAASGAIITNMRHISALRDALSSLNNAVNSLKAGMPQDIASIDLNMAMSALGEITGETVSDDIVSKIFHNFCVGK